MVTTKLDDCAGIDAEAFFFFVMLNRSDFVPPADVFLVTEDGIQITTEDGKDMVAEWPTF